MKANAFCFDGDAALALEVHRVEHLLVHFALRKRDGHLQQTVGKRGLAVIDMRDDTKIAYELRVHGIRLSLPLRDRFILFSYRQEPHASRSLDARPRKTVPCDSSVCHKLQDGAARSPGKSKGRHFAANDAVIHTASR